MQWIKIKTTVTVEITNFGQALKEFQPLKNITGWFFFIFLEVD